MEEKNKYIRFDWAMRRLLRSKNNFGVLEGFLTTLLQQEITIDRLCESGDEEPYYKLNRIDLWAKNEQGECVLIEIQNNTEYVYYQRIIFGTSKTVTAYANQKKADNEIRKIYCINILYFNLGRGTDVLYRGYTELRGIHNGELLRLSPFKLQTFEENDDYGLSPEYYVLKVDKCNHWSEQPLEQWCYYLHTNHIPDDATAPGLQEARSKLCFNRLGQTEQNGYYHYLNNLVILQDNIETARGEGYWEGYESGRAKRTKHDIALKMKSAGASAEIIAQCTGLTPEEIAGL